MNTLRLQRLLPSVLAAVITLIALLIFTRAAISRSHTFASAANSSQATGNLQTAAAAGPPARLRNLSPDERKNDIAGQVRTILAMQDRLEQRRALLGLVQELDSAGLATAFDTCMAGDPMTRRSNEGVILDEWIRRDPAAAMDRASNQEPKFYSGWAERVLSQWAEDDPSAPLQWVLSGPDDRRGYLPMLVRKLAEKDPGSVVESLGAVPASLRIQTLRTLAVVQTAQTFTLTTNWIESLPTASERLEAIGATTSAGTPETLPLRFDLLLRYPEALSSLDFDKFFSQWARYDAASLPANVERIPAGEEHARAVHAAVPSLVISHLDLATAMMDRYPEQIDDDTIYASVSTLSQSDRPTALKLGERIQDPFLREQAMVEILSRWLSAGDERAQPWIDAHDLPDSVRAKIAHTP